MLRMRVFRTLLVVAVAATGLIAPVPVAAAPTISTESVVFDSNRTGNYEIFVMGTDGSSPRQLTKDSRFDSWWPKISPNRTKILFYRVPKGVHDTDYGKTSLWVMNADGSGVRQLLANRAYGWDVNGHAEWSPDGTKLVLFGGPSISPQIFVTDAEGRNPRAVTNRGGTNVDPSWSPDGRRILFTGCASNVCPSSLFDLFVVNVDGTGLRQLTSDLMRDHDAYFSPDGRRIAWLRETHAPAPWSLYVMNADGTGQRAVVEELLTVNSKPGWSVRSDWIYFHRTGFGRTLFNVFKVRPDGSGLTELEARSTIGTGAYDNEYPVNSSF